MSLKKKILIVIIIISSLGEGAGPA